MKSRHRLLAIIGILLFTSCSQKTPNIFTGNALGTYYRITYVGNDDPTLPSQVDSIFQNVCDIFSIFDSTSIVSRFNRNEAVGAQAVFTHLAKLSTQVSHQTGGAFDITVGPLVNLWGFGNETEHAVTQQEIDSVLQFVGYEKVFINEKGEVNKKDPRIQLNFNAIAKGYAVDKIAIFLQGKGYSDFLVDVGGEVRASGTKPGGKRWNVGIQIPTETRDGVIESDYIFELEGKSVATSGNYRNYKEINGMRIQHITDPRTGTSRTSNLLSATVIANDCATADAYATAFMVTGIEEAKNILKKHPEMSAHFIYFENGAYHFVQTDNFPKPAK